MIAKFTCVDCGVPVESFGAPTRAVELKVCATCWFLRTIPDEARREEMRRALNPKPKA